MLVLLLVLLVLVVIVFVIVALANTPGLVVVGVDLNNDTGLVPLT